jgi:hypothetical protein
MDILKISAKKFKPEFFQRENSRIKSCETVFYQAWKPRREPVDDGGAGKAKGVNI